MWKISSFSIEARTVLHIWSKYFEKTILLQHIINHDLIVSISRYEYHAIKIIFDIFSHSIEDKCHIYISLFLTPKSLGFFVEYEYKSCFLKILIETSFLSPESHKIVCFFNLIFISQIYPEFFEIDRKKYTHVQILSIDECCIMYSIFLHKPII